MGIAVEIKELVSLNCSPLRPHSYHGQNSSHCSDVKIDSDSVSNHRRIEYLLDRLFRRRSKKISKLRVTGLCEGNSPVTGEFSAQRTSNSEKRFYLTTSSRQGKSERIQLWLNVLAPVCYNVNAIHICHMVDKRVFVCPFLIFVSFLISLHHLGAFFHDDVIKWKHFPRYWPFVQEIHRSLVNFPHKGQWRGDFMFSLTWINAWINNREASDLRRNRAHYNVIVMCQHALNWIPAYISNHMPSKVWDEITYPFPNFNGAAVEVWEWISNFIPHFIMVVKITYPC